MKFAGKTVLLNGMLIFQMFPAVLALVAIYALFDKIGDYIPWLGLNTHGGLILSYMGGIALHIWTIKGYFETIDSSLEEAAAIDGATPWQAFRLILLPLSVPILAVVFILAFIGTITEVPVASVLLLDMNELTLAVGSQQYISTELPVGRFRSCCSSIRSANYHRVLISTALVSRWFDRWWCKGLIISLWL